MAGKYRVSVIIPNLNGEKLLEKNLPYFIKAWDQKSNSIAEIIVVDDGSWDESVSFLKNKYPRIKVIKHKVNRGFSAAVNTGARAAKGDLLLLINTDVLPQENFLEPALKCFDDDKVFAVSLHEKKYGYAKGSFVDGYIGLFMGPESQKTEQSFYVSGGSGIFRRKYWMDMGGMDEKLLSPFYWEDIDICYRASKRGYINLWVPGGKVVHHHESTISKLSKKYVERVRERNQLLVIWKNIHSTSLLRKHVIGVLKRLIAHPGYLRIVLFALTRIGVALKSRSKEIKESKISDEAIFSRFV